MDTTRSQQCANCSDCMLPCRVFLGLSSPKALNPPTKKPTALKQSCVPLRPFGQEASVAPRSGRSISSGQLPGRTATSLQREPGAIRPVPHVVSSPAVSRVQERGRTLDSHATAAGAAQTSFMQTQQANPSPQYPLVRAAIVPLNRPGEGPVMAPVYRGQLSNPVITTAQSVHGVSHSSQFPTYIVPVLSAGAQAEIGVGTGTVAGTAAAARPAATYTSFAEQNSGEGQVACFVGPNGELYVRSNVASSAGSATPLSQQQMNACRSPSSAARSLSGSVTRAPVPVLVVQGRSQSVAPPLPRVYAAPASEPLGVYDETGMSVQEVKTPAKDGGYSMEKPVPIELDPSLRDVLDGQMLSSRSRVLAMELKNALYAAGSRLKAGFRPVVYEQAFFLELVCVFRLLSIVESIEKRIEDLQIQLSGSKKEPVSVDGRVDIGSGLMSEITDSQSGVNVAKGLSSLERKAARSGHRKGNAEVLDICQREATAKEGKAPGPKAAPPLLPKKSLGVVPKQAVPVSPKAGEGPAATATEGAAGEKTAAGVEVKSEVEAKEGKAPGPKAAPALLPKKSLGVVPKKALPVSPKAEAGPAAKAAEAQAAAKTAAAAEGTGEVEAKEGKAPGPKAAPALLPKKSLGMLPPKALPDSPKAGEGPAAKAAEGAAGEKPAAGIEVKSEVEAKEGKAPGPKAAPALLPRKSLGMLPKTALPVSPKAGEGPAAKAAEGGAGEKSAAGVEVKSEVEAKEGKAPGPKAAPALLPKTP
ncbi:hypothetical protein, conserved, partial [Eimeria acervulina]